MPSLLKTFPLLLAAFAGTPSSGADPGSVRLVTSDIDAFWRVYDRATPENRRDLFQRDYLDKGSPGLQDFITARIKNVDRLLAVMDKYPAFYRTMRPATLKVHEQEPMIRGYLRRFRELYPEAELPDVYFLIGVANSGGTTSSRALLIGSEMYARAPGTDEHELSDWHKAVLKPIAELPVIVIHELVHVQQKSPPNGALLEKSMGEGAADFVSYLVTGKTINAHLDQWAEPKRDKLFTEFAAAAEGSDYKNWLYNGDSIKDRPADLGYWIGAQICTDYYERAGDKKGALREIMQMRDAKQIVRGTKYAALFTFK